MDAIIFDMDGVVVNSVSYKHEHWREIIQGDFGVNDVDIEALIGLNTTDKHGYLVENHGLDADQKEFATALNKDIDEIYRERAELLDGLESTFKMLVERSKKVGLASAASRPKVELVVDRFGLDEWLDVAVSADDIPHDSKPDPAIYQHTASLLSADPASCLAVEDSTHGVTAATEAGMYCLGYNPPASPDRDLGHADEIVTTPDELHARIEAIVDSDCSS